ncbi:GDP-mannose 4,6-dehydratase, partial [Streptomyces chryseus]
GDAGRGPLKETTPAHPTNPYAASKYACEQILTDMCADTWRFQQLNPHGYAVTARRTHRQD